MRYKRFDVVKLKDENKAVILDKDDNQYFAEIVDNFGKTLEYRNISAEEIKNIVFSKKDIER